MQLQEILSDPKFFTIFSVVVVLVGLAAIAAGVEKVVSIWHKVKREPSLDQTLSQLPTKVDLTRTESNLRQEIIRGDTALRGEIDDLEARHSKEIRAMRSYNSKTTGEIFDLLRQQNTQNAQTMANLTATMSKEFSDLNRDLGELRGELRAKRETHE